MRELRFGMRGPRVNHLQFLLKMQRPYLPGDLQDLSECGCFGPITHQWLCEFQKCHNLEPTGIFDHCTEIMMCPWATLHATFTPVRQKNDQPAQAAHKVSLGVAGMDMKRQERKEEKENKFEVSFTSGFSSAALFKLKKEVEPPEFENGQSVSAAVTFPSWHLFKVFTLGLELGGNLQGLDVAMKIAIEAFPHGRFRGGPYLGVAMMSKLRREKELEIAARGGMEAQLIVLSKRDKRGRELNFGLVGSLGTGVNIRLAGGDGEGKKIGDRIHFSLGTTLGLFVSY